MLPGRRLAEDMRPIEVREGDGALIEPFGIGGVSQLGVDELSNVACKSAHG